MSKATTLATKIYQNAVQQCESIEEVSELCQMLGILCSKTVHGIEGDEFKKDFLTAAIADRERITPQRMQ